MIVEITATYRYQGPGRRDAPPRSEGSIWTPARTYDPINGALHRSRPLWFWMDGKKAGPFQVAFLPRNSTSLATPFSVHRGPVGVHVMAVSFIDWMTSSDAKK